MHQAGAFAFGAEARRDIKKVNKGARGMPVALGGEEGRDKLRKAAERGKYPLSSADVRMGEPGGRRLPSPLQVGRTRGTETSKYPQEEKVKTIAPVAASERARAQTDARACRGSDRKT